MTTVTDSALARFNASIQKRSSIKLSLAGKTVDCTTYTRRPRTFSLTRTNRFPSEKWSTSPAPGCTFKYSQILSVSLDFPCRQRREFHLPLSSPPKPDRFKHSRHLLALLDALVGVSRDGGDIVRTPWASAVRGKTAVGGERTIAFHSHP